MTSMKTLVAIFFILYSIASLKAEVICPKDRSDYFCISPDMAPESAVKFVDFYVIPSKIIGLFQEELKKAPAPLILDAHWESPYFGAGVSLYQNQIKLMILGGMVRVPGVSLEAYAAVICHELGHMIGGYPFQTIEGAEWTSAEGQADFFAASICLPRYFRSLGLESSIIPKAVETSGFEMMWAYRKFDSSTINIGLTRSEVQMPKVQKTLLNQYPSLQCRYENFRNPKQRPTCWFKD